jgi:hypothetical protein
MVLKILMVVACWSFLMAQQLAVEVLPCDYKMMLLMLIFRVLREPHARCVVV